MTRAFVHATLRTEPVWGGGAYFSSVASRGSGSEQPCTWNIWSRLRRMISHSDCDAFECLCGGGHTRARAHTNINTNTNIRAAKRAWASGEIMACYNQAGLNPISMELNFSVLHATTLHYNTLQCTILHDRLLADNADNRKGPKSNI